MKIKSKIDEIINSQKKKQEEQDRKFQELKAACGNIFQSRNGKIFLKFLKDLCLWDEQDCNINNDNLAYKKGRRDIWVIVRNLLPKELLVNIEIYNNEI